MALSICRNSIYVVPLCELTLHTLSHTVLNTEDLVMVVTVLVKCMDTCRAAQTTVDSCAKSMQVFVQFKTCLISAFYRLWNHMLPCACEHSNMFLVRIHVFLYGSVQKCTVPQVGLNFYFNTNPEPLTVKVRLQVPEIVCTHSFTQHHKT